MNSANLNELSMELIVELEQEINSKLESVGGKAMLQPAELEKVHLVFGAVGIFNADGSPQTIVVGDFSGPLSSLLGIVDSFVKFQNDKPKRNVYTLYLECAGHMPSGTKFAHFDR